MTVASDLATAGKRRNLFLKIDGFEPILWQPSTLGEPSGWSRSIKSCLHSPQEYSAGLNLTEASVDLSAMSFTLSDILDPADNQSYFAKFFVPGKWDTGNHWRLEPSDSYNDQIDANAATIDLRANTGLSASGTLYIGKDTFTYSNVSTNQLTGVERGKYPCVGSGDFAETVELPIRGSAAYLPMVSENPFSYVGRRVALYMTTWDSVNASWNAEANAKLLWAGRITDRIVYSPNEKTWVLSCTSIMQDLERKLFENMPEIDLHGINLSGDWGRKFFVGVMFTLADDVTYWGSKIAGSGSVITYIRNCEVSKKIYKDVGELMIEIQKELNGTYTRLFDGQSVDPLGVSFTVCNDNGKCRIFVEPETHMLEGDCNAAIHISFAQSGVLCHAFQALGFKATSALGLEFETENMTDFPSIDAEENYFEAYHPLHYSSNAGNLYYDGHYTKPFWIDQDADHTENGFVELSNTCFPDGQKRTYTVGYTSQVDNYTPYMTINEDGTNLNADSLKGSYAGSRYGEEKCKIKQVYVPPVRANGNGKRRGPFELLLFNILSTGTTGFNHATYDVLPLQCSLGVQVDLVDIESFLQADAECADHDLNNREGYILDEGISALEYIQRECKLFGYALVWRDGKIALQDIVNPPLDVATITLTESNMILGTGRPRVEESTETVINQYDVEIFYDQLTKKYTNKTTISDMDSIMSLGVTKSMSIKHPGIFQPEKIGGLLLLLEDTLRNRDLRYPLQTVEVSIMPNLLGLINVGDVVKFQSNFVPNSTGTGSLTTDCYALVQNLSWNYKTGVGKVKLILLTRKSNIKNCWTSAAMLDPDFDPVLYPNGVDPAGTTLVLGEHYSDGSNYYDGLIFGNGNIISLVDKTDPDADAAIYGTNIAITDVTESGGVVYVTIDTNIASTVSAGNEYDIMWDNLSVSSGSIADEQGVFGASTEEEYNDRDNETFYRYW